jgi:NDP-sugar pyrophosphorylase family protein
MSDDRIRKAVILAAGRGTRMGELTTSLPKPMLPVHGRPMLVHVLERLETAGVQRFLIVTGYQRESIESHFRNWRLPVDFRVQEPVNGTAPAVLLAREFAGDQPFLLTFGDILCGPADYVRCEDVLREHPATVAVLGVRETDDPWRGAAVYVKDGKVEKVIEKPPRGTSSTRWNSAGVYALRPVVFDYLARVPLSSRNEYELTSIFDMMIHDGLELRSSEIAGDWRDVGSPVDLDAANS